MNVVSLGVVVVGLYFFFLHVLEPHLTKHTDRMMQYSANLWITLGGIALLASYHQSRKANAREKAELALRLSEKWGDINKYLLDGGPAMRPLVRLVYESEGGGIDIASPEIRLGIDYIIEKCYEMWVLTVAMDINLSSLSTSSGYGSDLKSMGADKRPELAAAATQPVHILVGSVFVIPEFYLLLNRGKKFYPQAFLQYVDACISLYRSRKNPRTGKYGFVDTDRLPGARRL